jgi:hypothetical protein
MTKDQKILSAVIGVGHFFLMAGMLYYCIDQYYEQPCPVNSLAQALAYPAFLLTHLLDDSSFWYLNLLALPINSYLWGVVITLIYHRVVMGKKSKA